MYMSYLSCIKNSDLPSSGSCPVNRNVNDEVSSFGIGFKWMHISFEVKNDVHINKILREEFLS